MYQSDISDLAIEEVDWVTGRLRRTRSKTPDGPVVTYQLWPETFALLKQHCTQERVPNERGGHRALLSEEGRPLVCYWMEDGKMRRYDLIQSAFGRLFDKLKMKKSIKLFRKTSASELGAHPTYGAYVQHFLAHSPRGVTDRHYVVPDQDRFDEALAWLRSRYLK